MITKQDLQTLEENLTKKINNLDTKVDNLEENLVRRIDAKIEIRLDEKLEEKFSEKIGLLPSKEEFLKAMDQIMTELQTIRQEQVVNTHRLNDHDRKFASLTH